jgi:hypothetical protein
MLDIGPGEGTYIAYRKPGQFWTGVEVSAPYVEKYDLEKKYDQIVVADVRTLDLDTVAPIDLAVCGDVLEHMAKDEALNLLDGLLGRARVVLVSIPVEHWTHEECLSALPDICLARKELPVGIYFLSRSTPDRDRLAEIERSLNAAPLTAAAVGYFVAARSNLQLLENYCSSRVQEDPANIDEVVATLEAVCAQGASDAAERAVQLGLLVLHKDARDRRRSSASPYNAVSLEDWPCRFVEEEVGAWQETSKQWIEDQPNSVNAYLSMAHSLIAAGSAIEAEPYYARLRTVKMPHPACAANFDPKFHDGLEQAAVVVAGGAPGPAGTASQKPTLFSACDFLYFQKYGWPFVGSLARWPLANVSLHLHLFDATEEEAAAVSAHAARMGLKHVSIFREWTGMRTPGLTQVTDAMRCYYHAARYFRFWQFTESQPRTATWLLDTDLIFNRPPGELFDLLNRRDVSLLLVPGRVDAHNKVAAGLVGVSPTPAARRFLRRVSGYLGQYMRAGIAPWGIDQTALYSVLAVDQWRNSAPSLTPVSARIYDGEFGDDTVIWPGKCNKHHPSFPRFRDAVQSLERDVRGALNVPAGAQR